MPYQWTFVSICHGGSRPRWCTEEGICGVINNVDCHGSLLITCTTHFSVTLSLTCMWDGASHARCVIVESVATTRVQNFAGSWIKSASCWKKVLLRLTCDLSLSVYFICTTVGQHLNWHRVARVSDSWAFCYTRAVIWITGRAFGLQKQTCFRNAEDFS